MPSGFIISDVIWKWNMSQGLIVRIDDGGMNVRSYNSVSYMHIFI